MGDRRGANVGINRFSDIEERKRNETDAKAGDELPAENKGDASSRLQASEDPAENEEKREVVEKLKERGSS
jgi:predicted transcriptional regulator YheO